MFKYKIEVNINAKAGEYEAICEVNLDNKEEKVEFLIHKNIFIKNIVSEGDCLQYDISDFNELQFMPESKKLTVFGKEINNFTICYKVYLEEIEVYKINSIKPDTIELNIYSPWYPVRIDLPNANFDIKVNGLEEFELIHGTKLGKQWNINIDSQNDAYLIAYKNVSVNTVNNESINIKIYSNSDKGKEIANMIESKLEEIYNFFVELFGNNDKIFKLTIAIMNRTVGGGYFRNNLIVVPIDNETDEEWIHFLAHELAHKWWTGASTTTWEDWLNESIAELSSWLYIEYKLGDSAYKKTINEYNEKIKQCPPIIDLERSNKYVYYSRFKGAQIISKLREKFGNKKMINILKLLMDLPERSTDNWISAITKIGYEDISKWLLAELEK